MMEFVSYGLVPKFSSRAVCDTHKHTDIVGFEGKMIISCVTEAVMSEVRLKRDAL